MMAIWEIARANNSADYGEGKGTYPTKNEGALLSGTQKYC
jgi:hypothetical protein